MLGFLSVSYPFIGKALKFHILVDNDSIFFFCTLD
jgi:hypothetical protein